MATALLLCALAAACAAKRPSSHTLEVGNAFLWQATRQGSDAGRLYLLGAIHVLDVPVELGPRLAQAFGEAEELLVELDPSSLEPLRLIDIANYFSRFAPRQTLRDHLDDVSYRRLRRFLVNYPPPERLVWDIDGTQPWLLLVWASTALMSRAGLGAENGIDPFFVERARDTIPITPLETPADQFAAMASVPLDEQAAALVTFLEAWDSRQSDPRREARDLVAAWKAGDDAALLPALEPDTGFAEKLLYQRNELMAARLAARLDSGGTRFAVVGALHLIGKRSIVEELRARGYRVERLR